MAIWFQTAQDEARERDFQQFLESQGYDVIRTEDWTPWDFMVRGGNKTVLVEFKYRATVYPVMKISKKKVDAILEKADLMRCSAAWVIQYKEVERSQGFRIEKLGHQYKWINLRHFRGIDKNFKRNRNAETRGDKAEPAYCYDFDKFEGFRIAPPIPF